MRSWQRVSRMGPDRRWIAWVSGLVVAFMLVGGSIGAARSSAVAILPPVRPVEGAQPFATLLCKFSDAADEPLSPAYFDRLMFEGPASLDRYWRAVSYDKINLAGSRAYGWFAMASPAAAYRRGPDSANLEALARDCARAADSELSFKRFTGINMVFNRCIGRPRGGEMALSLDGERRRFRVTWLCPGASSAHQIVAHEMGHSFGLTHSADSTGDEYGNTWDVMSVAGYCAADQGHGSLAQETIAVNKDLLGWIPPERKYRSAGANEQTIELVAPDETANGYLLAEIPLGRGRSYTVEARRRSGFDKALPADGVLLHEVEMQRDNKARLVSPPRGAVDDVPGLFGGWGVGQTFQDTASGVAVSIDKATATGFVVTIRRGALPALAVSTGHKLGTAPRASAPPLSKASILCDESNAQLIAP